MDISHLTVWFELFCLPQNLAVYFLWCSISRPKIPVVMLWLVSLIPWNWTPFLSACTSTFTVRGSTPSSPTPVMATTMSWWSPSVKTEMPEKWASGLGMNMSTCHTASRPKAGPTTASPGHPTLAALSCGSTAWWGSSGICKAVTPSTLVVCSSWAKIRMDSWESRTQTPLWVRWLMSTCGTTCWPQQISGTRCHVRETTLWWEMCSAGEPLNLVFTEGCSWRLSTDAPEEAQLLLFLWALKNQNVPADGAYLTQ